MTGQARRMGPPSLAQIVVPRIHTHHPSLPDVMRVFCLVPTAHPFALFSLHNPCSRSRCLAPQARDQAIQSWGGSSTKEATPKVRGWEWPEGFEKSEGKRA